MSNIRTALAATIVAAGVVTLSACGGGSSKPAAQPAAQTTAANTAAAGTAASSAAAASTASSSASGSDNSGGDALSSQMQYQNGTAKANNAPDDTGDFYNGPRTDAAALNWVQLSAGEANGLQPIVHDGRGFTMYRFDKDTPNPSASHCDGACAKTWPPVLVRPGSKVFVDGVPVNEIGVTRRDDGTLQLTIGKWPIYRFSKDTAPGQTNGEGVGGIWFAVSPTGSKVLPVGGSAPSGAPSAAATTSTSSSRY
jgi:predicted lipoprotein with Yx(FWY)xxD motif